MKVGTDAVGDVADGGDIDVAVSVANVEVTVIEVELTVADVEAGCDASFAALWRRASSARRG